MVQFTVSLTPDIQLLKAINDIDGYEPEVQPILKRVAIERKLVNEDLNYLVENFDDKTREFYETIILSAKSNQLFSYVPLKIRFFHLLIDYIGFYLFFYLAFKLLGYGDYIRSSNMDLLTPVFYFVYFFFMELVYGKTVGKFITKTKVVDYKKQKPKTNQILIRSLCRLIPFEPFSFFFGERPIGWHDTLSKTYVVYEE